MLALRSKIASIGLKRSPLPCERSLASLKTSGSKSLKAVPKSLVASFSRLGSLKVSQTPLQRHRIIAKRSFCIQSTHESFDDEIEEPTTADAALELALPLWTELKLEEAVAVLERYLARPDHTGTPHHIAVLKSAPLYVNLGLMLTTLARFKDAIRIYQILIDAADTQLTRWDGLVKKTLDEVKHLPKEDPNAQQATDFTKQIGLAKVELEASLLAYQHDLGTAYVALGDYLAAQKAFTRSLELHDRQPQRGDDMNGLLNSSLSMVYESIGNYKLAAKHHAMALRSAPTIEKFDHPHLATMLHSTHFLKDTASERARLEGILDESDPNWRVKFHTIKTKEEMYDDMMLEKKEKENAATGQLQQPQALLPADSNTTQEVDANESPLPTVDNGRYVSYFGSSEVMEALQAHAEKESVLVAEVLKQYRKRLAINDIAIVPILLQLATLRRRCASFVESLELVDEALRLVSETKGHKHAYYATALMHKSIHYHTTGDLVSSEVFARQAHQLREEILGSDHLHVGLAAYDLAILLGKRSLSKESIAYLHSCVDIFKVALFEDHPFYTAVKSSLDQANQLVTKQQMEETQAQISGVM